MPTRHKKSCPHHKHDSSTSSSSTSSSKTECHKKHDKHKCHEHEDHCCKQRPICPTGPPCPPYPPCQPGPQIYCFQVCLNGITVPGCIPLNIEPVPVEGTLILPLQGSGLIYIYTGGRYCLYTLAILPAYFFDGCNLYLVGECVHPQLVKANEGDFAIFSCEETGTIRFFRFNGECWILCADVTPPGVDSMSVLKSPNKNVLNGVEDRITNWHPNVLSTIPLTAFYNDLPGFDAVEGRWTVQEAGKYAIKAKIWYDFDSEPEDPLNVRVALKVVRGTTTTFYLDTYPYATYNGFYIADLFGDLQFEVGDVLYLSVTNNSGETLTVLGSLPLAPTYTNRSTFSIHKIA